MNRIKKYEGFTVIELIVGINLSFLLITLAISFYLFAYKFIFTTTKRFDQKQNINSFFYYTDKVQNEAETFSLGINDDEIILVSNKSDSIVFCISEIILNGMYEIESPETYSVTCNFIDDDRLIINDSGILYSPYYKELYLDNLSKYLMDLSIQVTKNNHVYSLIFFNSAISSKRFINITE